MKTYKNIIFDLGGVILNIEYEKTIEAFSELCGKPVAPIYSQAQQEPIFDQYEMGLISDEAFRDGLRNILQLEISDDKVRLI